MSKPQRLAEELYRIGAVRFGDFVLKDGRHSPFYVDLRVLISAPPALARVAAALCKVAEGIRYDCLAGIPYAGLPLAVAMSLQNGRPLVYPRKETKSYGTRRRVEGVFESGQRALVIDDVITSGGAKLEAIVPLREEGLLVDDILVVVDREESGARALAAAGLHLHRVFSISGLLGELDAAGVVEPARVQEVRSFLASQTAPS